MFRVHEGRGNASYGGVRRVPVCLSGLHLVSEDGLGLQVTLMTADRTTQLINPCGLSDLL